MREEIKITKHYPTGFNISIGVGKLFYARDTEEIKQAVEHYFRLGKHKKFGKQKNCPLCREEEKRV